MRYLFTLSSFVCKKKDSQVIKCKNIFVKINIYSILHSDMYIPNTVWKHTLTIIIKLYTSTQKISNSCSSRWKCLTIYKTPPVDEVVSHIQALLGTIIALDVPIKYIYTYRIIETFTVCKQQFYIHWFLLYVTRKQTSYEGWPNYIHIIFTDFRKLSSAFRTNLKLESSFLQEF